MRRRMTWSTIPYYGTLLSQGGNPVRHLSAQGILENHFSSWNITSYPIRFRFVPVRCGLQVAKDAILLKQQRFVLDH
jgi:hypothetical protein